MASNTDHSYAELSFPPCVCVCVFVCVVWWGAGRGLTFGSLGILRIQDPGPILLTYETERSARL